MTTYDTPGATVEEPILDPYVDAAGVPAVTGTAATGSGAHRGLQDGSRHAGGRHRLLWFVALTSLLGTFAAVGAVGWGYFYWSQLVTAQNEEPSEEEEPETKRAGLPAEEPAEQPSKPTNASGGDKPVPSVPDDTRMETRGGIDVVDVGLSSPSLDKALRAQHLLARAKRQTLLVMTTGADCAPCRGVARSLDDPLMQQALSGVRLVRVDLKAFKEELTELRMPTSLYPAFFLVGDDLTPLDGVHGGEWDDDIAANIAPVLGPFLRGEYKQRRHEWSPTIDGISL